MIKFDLDKLRSIAKPVPKKHKRTPEEREKALREIKERFKK